MSVFFLFLGCDQSQFPVAEFAHVQACRADCRAQLRGKEGGHRSPTGWSLHELHCTSVLLPLTHLISCVLVRSSSIASQRWRARAFMRRQRAGIRASPSQAQAWRPSTVWFASLLVVGCAVVHAEQETCFGALVSRAWPAMLASGFLGAPCIAWLTELTSALPASHPCRRRRLFEYLPISLLRRSAYRSVTPAVLGAPGSCMAHWRAGHLCPPPMPAAPCLWSVRSP